MILNFSCLLSKDPVHDDAGWRKSFYHLCHSWLRQRINHSLSTPDVDRLAPSYIQLTFGPDDVHEEIETWKEVLGFNGRAGEKSINAHYDDETIWLTH